MEQAEQLEDTNYGTCRKCKRWEVIKDRVRIKELLEKAIGKIEAEIQEDKFKPTLGDYLKLIALEKEAEQEDIKEIRVTWVGPTPQSEKSAKSA